MLKLLNFDVNEAFGMESDIELMQLDYRHPEQQKECFKSISFVVLESGILGCQNVWDINYEENTIYV